MQLSIRILLAVPLIFFLSPSVPAQTLHAIVVGDISPSAGWGKYTSAVAMDLTLVSSTISNNMPEQQINFIRLEIEEDEFSSPQHLLNSVDLLEVHPNDAILFYFSGHGSTDDKGHHFLLAQGKLYRQDLLAKLNSKKARFVALVSDCCNTRGDGYMYAAPNILIKHPRVPTPLFKRLFMDPTGVADINSCSPGESAFFAPLESGTGSPGSIFTLEWIEWIDLERRNSRTWDEMIRAVSLKVHTSFHDYYPKGASVAKGAPVQSQQNVFPLSYPGMPATEGPRTGLIVRDFPGRGAVITEVSAGSPASQVFLIKQDKFIALKPQQVVIAINGKATPNTEAVVQAVKQSPQIMRLTIRDANTGSMDVLLRMKY